MDRGHETITSGRINPVEALPVQCPGKNLHSARKRERQGYRRFVSKAEEANGRFSILVLPD